MSAVTRCIVCDSNEGVLAYWKNLLTTRTTTLRERAERAEYERDLFAEQLRNPAKLLNLLLDARGVEPLAGHEWGAEGLPAAIRIPADLSRAVFGEPDDAS